MNINCNAECKHKNYCALSAENTKTCKMANDAWAKPDELIFGRTGKQINKLQGRNSELQK